MATEQQRKFGYCECGCGQETRLAAQTRTSMGWIKDEPVRYVAGHGRRGKHLPPSVVCRRGDILEVSLSRGRGITLVDADDEAIVAGRRWRLRGGYVVTDHPAVALHRLVLGVHPAGLLIDHRNGDRLDNRRANLRFADHSLNNFNRRELDPKNTTGVPGVHRIGERFRASISHRSRFVYLGLFDSAAEAAEARMAAELFYFGEISIPTAAGAVELGLVVA